MISRIKGTEDTIEESWLWEWIEERFKGVATNFGFTQIRTPTFEATELFDRGVGNETDIVQKEMYTFEDKGGRSITLRPEGTAPVMRAFIEHNLSSKGLPQKLFYYGPMFRYEKPQSGRLREFHQFGAELIGSALPIADVFVISMAIEMLNSVGLTNFKLKINSTGDENCRPEYVKALKDYYRDLLPKLCDDCKVRYERNVLRLLDCKKDAEYAKDAPKITDYLCNDCKTHFDTLKRYLDELDIEYEVDPSIVRGLDYYTRTVFEFKYPALGAQDAIGGGGRYDRLIEELGGSKTPSVGFAFGIERIILALKMENKIPESKGIDIYVIAVDDAQRMESLKIAKALSKFFRVDVDIMGRNLKGQFSQASKENARFVIVIGEEEIKEGLYTVKNMKSGEQKRVRFSDIIEMVKA
ncbi:histidine--tRNA ligase [Athalassotoga saccharophila]|uniref:histidine--tRNA ligase n=1 Tax=Athalassotoga saccharophila TaxID=1441386 RepID=UPI00137B4B64|nr:histidine--tRNA ligase [Athalassotoga saccharophila]BBJ28301.1 histidine--tRNA ligase [Athalassotoga saccharophila]